MPTRSAVRLRVVVGLHEVKPAGPRAAAGGRLRAAAEREIVMRRERKVIRWLVLALVACGGLVSEGCQRSGSNDSPASSDAGLFLPGTIGAMALDRVEDFPSEFQEAAAAAAARIAQYGKNPALSFATIAKRSDDEIVVNIWPASKFGGSRPKGGGGSTLYFHRSAHQFVRAEAWQ
jgi:hypothetical protein